MACHMSTQDRADRRHLPAEFWDGCSRVGGVTAAPCVTRLGVWNNSPHLSLLLMFERAEAASRMLFFPVDFLVRTRNPPLDSFFSPPFEC